MDHFDNRYTTCPLCKNLHIVPLYKIERFEVPFALDHCLSCGFIFMNPPFSKEYSNSFYEKNYYEGSANYSYIDERKIKEFARHVWDKRIKVLHKYVPSGNFLDVGSSFGGLLEAANKFYTPHGIELSPYAAQAAQEATNFLIHIGTLENHPFKANYFSAITMIELIEHLKDPVKAIEECFNLLGNNGVLVIQTANMDGLQAKLKKEKYNYFLPGHLSYFSKKNLTQMLLRTGFKKVKAFIPVEFGLLPKLKKSRGSFNSLWDYRHWLRISAYHALGKLHFGNFCPTSSMVLYAFK